jgi:hypothetical protein
MLSLLVGWLFWTYKFSRMSTLDNISILRKSCKEVIFIDFQEEEV